MENPLYADNPERRDQYGRVSKWFLDYPDEYLDALVDELKALELIFRVEFGLDMYLSWGTLLGAVRDGNVIPHDFDFDVGYLSRARSAQGVTRERAKILKHFQSFDRALENCSPGRFMIKTIRSPHGSYDHGIDIYTSFVTRGRFYAYPTLPGTMAAKDVRPLREVSLRGRTFFAPRQAETFLDQAMGKDWRVPKLPKYHNVKDGRYECFEFLYAR